MSTETRTQILLYELCAVERTIQPVVRILHHYKAEVNGGGIQKITYEISRPKNVLIYIIIIF